MRFRFVFCLVIIKMFSFESFPYLSAQIRKMAGIFFKSGIEFKALRHCLMGMVRMYSSSPHVMPAATHSRVPGLRAEMTVSIILRLR